LSLTKVTAHRKQRNNRIFTVQKNGTEVTLSSTKTVASWNDTVVYGDNIPNWREVIKRGGDATTGLQVDGRQIDVHLGHMLAEWVIPPLATSPTQTVKWQQTGDFDLSYAFNSVDPSLYGTVTANNRALGKFLQNIQQVNTKFQGMTVVGEIAKTIHGIRHPAQGLFKLVDAYRHRAAALRSAEGFRVLRVPLEKHLADLWLESQFHWKPLMHDIADGIRALRELHKASSTRPTSQPVRAIGVAESNVSTITGTAGSGGIHYGYQETSKGVVTVVYRGAVRVNPINSSAGLLENFGFSLPNFLPTVWELMPYSFLIDYFTNIGDIVNGWSVQRTLLTWSNRTIIQESVVERSAHAVPSAYNGSQYRLISFSGPSVRTSRRKITRSFFDDLLVPSLEFELPSFGSTKWYNIGALVVSRASDLLFRLR